jgi:hypothetical protein
MADDESGARTAEDVRRELRYIASQLIVSVLRTISDIRFGTGEMHRNVDAILITLAIYIGEFEGWPTTAFKLSQFLGMPRSTMTRKADAMVKAGYLERHGRALRISQAWLDTPEGLQVARHLGTTLQSLQRTLASFDVAGLL